MKTKIAIVLIFLMCALNMVPGLFSETVYFDNVYYIILYFLLTFLGFSIPFLVSKLNKWIKRISNLIAGWCFAGLIIEFLNLTSPELVYNSKDDKNLYFKFIVMAAVGISVIMTSETWTKKPQKNL